MSYIHTQQRCHNDCTYAKTIIHSDEFTLYNCLYDDYHFNFEIQKISHMIYYQHDTQKRDEEYQIIIGENTRVYKNFHCIKYKHWNSNYSRIENIFKQDFANIEIFLKSLTKYDFQLIYNQICELKSKMEQIQIQQL